MNMVKSEIQRRVKHGGMLSITIVLLFCQISHYHSIVILSNFSWSVHCCQSLGISANQNATIDIGFHAELLLLTVLGHIAVSQEVHH